MLLHSSRGGALPAGACRAGAIAGVRRGPAMGPAVAVRVHWDHRVSRLRHRHVLHGARHRLHAELRTGRDVRAAPLGQLVRVQRARRPLRAAHGSRERREGRRLLDFLRRAAGAARSDARRRHRRLHRPPDVLPEPRARPLLREPRHPTALRVLHHWGSRALRDTVRGVGQTHVHGALVDTLRLCNHCVRHLPAFLLQASGRRPPAFCDGLEARRRRRRRL